MNTTQPTTSTTPDTLAAGPTRATTLIPEDQKGYQCEVLLDSINPIGIRLVTMRWKYPLIVHAEACRHRAFSRSVASNRAIPTAKIIAMVEQDPVVPVSWGRNQPGMQAEEELEGEQRQRALDAWHEAREGALEHCRRLLELGVHKQIANRILMPFQWVTEIVSATDWENFFALRCDPQAQPEIRKIAEMARFAYYKGSHPRPLNAGEWHIPLIRPEEFDLPTELKIKISAARSARTSYRTHDGRISAVEEDLKLYERLVGENPRHVSPTEHQAQALQSDERIGNFRGWRQHRYEIPDHTILTYQWSE